MSEKLGGGWGHIVPQSDKRPSRHFGSQQAIMSSTVSPPQQCPHTSQKTKFLVAARCGDSQGSCLGQGWCGSGVQTVPHGLQGGASNCSLQCPGCSQGVLPDRKEPCSQMEELGWVSGVWGAV